MSRVYHQYCRSCKHIMTSEEMDAHLKNILDPSKKEELGLCNACKAEQHARTFKQRFEALGSEPAKEGA